MIDHVNHISIWKHSEEWKYREVQRGKYKAEKHNEAAGKERRRGTDQAWYRARVVQQTTEDSTSAWKTATLHARTNFGILSCFLSDSIFLSLIIWLYNPVLGHCLFSENNWQYISHDYHWGWAIQNWSYHLIIIISLKWQNKWYPQIFLLFISLFPNCSSLTHSQSIHGKWNEFVRQFVRRPSHKSREKTKSKKIQNWILVCACLFSGNEPSVVWWWVFSKTLDSRQEW